MATSRLEQLQQKFGFKRAATGDSRQRRKDYLGARRRLNLRISEGLARDLEVLKLAGGFDKNSFCEKVLRDAVDRHLRETRSQFANGAWEVIVRCAERADDKG